MGGLGGGGGFCRVARPLALAVCCLTLANCSSGLSSRVDPRYGVAASARVVEPGEPVPKGGGVYRIGKPYVVAGRVYIPEEDPNYTAVGLASWYGDDFHGRYTANGEIFDMESISAAHPTMPLPSYARVTNLANHKSIVVRVNDRGPYAKGRLMDVSVKTAKLLGFYGQGTAKVKVDYVGRAPLVGSDDRKLVATLRDHGPAPAPSEVRIASAEPFVPRLPDRTPHSRSKVPMPPERPFTLGREPPRPTRVASRSVSHSATEMTAASRSSMSRSLIGAAVPASGVPAAAAFSFACLFSL